MVSGLGRSRTREVGESLPRTHVEGHLKCCLENSPQFYDRNMCREARQIAAALEFGRQREEKQQLAEEVMSPAKKKKKKKKTKKKGKKAAGEEGEEADAEADAEEEEEAEPPFVYTSDEQVHIEFIFMRLMDSGVLNIGSFYEG